MKRKLLVLGFTLAAVALAERPWPGRAVALEDHAPSAPTAAVRQATVELQQTNTPAASASATWPPTETPAPSRTPTALPSGTRTATPDESATPTSPRQVENEERPIIVLVSFDVDPGQPLPNSVFQLSLTVANKGEHLAENVTLSLASDTFFPVDQGTLLYKNSIKEGKSATFDLSMRVAAEAKPGAHGLAITMRWDDSYGGTYTDQTSIGIEVGDPGVRRPVVVVTAARLPGRVAPGVPFNLSLTLMNSGGADALNVVVVPTVGPLALQGTGGGGPVTIPPGATATISLRVMSATVAEPGAASQTLELRYDGPDGVRYTETQTVGLVVTGDAAFQPLPIVSGYRVLPAELHPGEVFELRLEILNVGVSAALRTLMALGGGTAPAASTTGGTSGGTSLGVFAPLETSNVRFLGQLKVGETQAVNQRMVVDGTAKPGVYVLDVDFNYVDANGNALRSSEVISLLVSRKVTLSINPIGVITSTVVGEPVPFSVELINAGGATVNVTTAEVVGGRYMDVQDGTRFVGPLDAGGADTLDATLAPKAPGEAEVKVVVHFLDDFNREQQVEETFKFTIEEAPEAPPAAEAPERAGGNLVIRILKGLLGLGASPPIPEPVPTQDSPPPGMGMQPAEAP